jgi:hypothetical protein
VYWRSFVQLFLDDVRNPPVGDDWAVVRSFDEAVNWMKCNQFPYFVSFDQHLGDGQKTGEDFAQWLIEFDITHNKMPYDFTFAVHSDRPEGLLIRTKMMTYCFFKQNNLWLDPFHRAGRKVGIAA